MRTVQVGRASKFNLAGLAAVLVVILALTATSGGARLNETAFVDSAMKLRAALNLRATLDPSIRLIIFDDRSLQELKRPPRASEWLRISQELEALGFERILFDGLADFGDPTARGDSPKAFMAGVVDYPKNATGSAFEAAALPEHLTLAANGRGAALPESMRLLGPNPAALDVVARYGLLNVEGETSVPMGRMTSGGQRVLPHLSLYALDGLEWRDGAFRWRGGTVPRPEDGLYFTDFVSPGEILGAARRFGALFDSDGRFKLSEASRRHLTGGKVAVLAPEGHTGSRFIDSPIDGKVPTYMGFVSLVNGFVKGRPVYRPWSRVAHGLALTLLLGLALFPWRYRHALVAGFSLLVAHSLLGIALLHHYGWILPVTEVALGGCVAVLWRSVGEYTRTAVAKVHYEHELEIGRTVQELCLPAVKSFTRGDWEVAIRHIPFGPMFGDWFQVATAGDEAAGKAGDEILVSIGDVAGKGPSAALATTVIATVWNRHAAALKEGHKDPASKLLKEIDVALRSTFHSGQYSTASLAVLYPNKITLSSCGAPAWMSFVPGGGFVKLRVRRNDPLGFVSQLTQVMELEVTPTPGQVFVGFTDGVLDGVRGQVQLQKQLETLDPAIASGPLEALIDHLYALANGADENSALPDDQTFLVIRYAPRVAAAAA